MNTNDVVAPNSAEAEEALLGSVIIDPDAYYDVAFLQAADFFILRNGWVWQAIQALHERHEGIDNLTVVAELEAVGKLENVGGSAYITRLINSVPTFDHAETYARLIERAAMRRRLLAAAGEVAQAALQGDVDVSEAIDRAQQAIEAVATRRSAAFMVSGIEVVNSAVDKFLEWTGDPATVRGLKSGIPELDRETGGFEPGRPYTLYGATNMGKSTLAAFLAVNLAEQGPGFIVTTEMIPEFWIHRSVSDLSGIPFNKLKSGQLNKEEKHLAGTIYDRLSRLAPHLNVLRLSTPTPADIKGNVRKLMRQGLCRWVLIDSINNITVPGVNEIYPQTSAAASCAQSIGVDLGAVVLQTSQIGRNVKMRDNKMPRLNDGEGSGKIEQTSAMVFGIYRHDYYVKRGEAKPSATFPEGGTILSVLKNETGPSGQWIPLRFEPGGFVHDNRTSKPSKPTIDYDHEHNNEDE